MTFLNLLAIKGDTNANQWNTQKALPEQLKIKWFISKVEDLDFRSCPNQLKPKGTIDDEKNVIGLQEFSHRRRFGLVPSVTIVRGDADHQRYDDRAIQM